MRTHWTWRAIFGFLTLAACEKAAAPIAADFDVGGSDLQIAPVDVAADTAQAPADSDGTDVAALTDAVADGQPAAELPVLDAAPELAPTDLIATDAQQSDAPAGQSDAPAGQPDAPTVPTCAVVKPLPALVPAPQPTGLAVHEWGTFTSMQNAAGQTLEGMHHEDEPLPAFVHGRLVDGSKSKGVEVLAEEVTQKMETPVIYFHAAKAVDVTVKVDFPLGIIGQWFPDAQAFLPPLKDPPLLQNGSMTWIAHVDPALQMSAAPAVDAKSIWFPSRQTSATPIKAAGEVERLIFYRGLGKFTLPLVVTHAADGTVSIKNSDALAVPSALLLRVDASGTGDAVAVGPIPPGATIKVATPTLACADATDHARTLLRDALMGAGLYDDESRALLDTWQHSYFQTPGLRLLYVLPQPWTEGLLPMALTPKPDALVRVLVGRVEVLTAAEEAATLANLKAWYTVWNAGVSWQGVKPLLAKDRFLEAKLRSLQPSVTEPTHKMFLENLLTEMDGQVIIPAPVSQP